MKKRDLIVVIVLIILIGIVYLISNKKNESDYAYVYYDNEIIDEIDLSVDGYYDYEGDYGEFHIEVVEGKYRAVDVECPNHTCEKVGWVSSESSTPIVCLPNNIYVIQEESSIEDID